ncbi:N-6 DNA methylase [Baekduia soli]|uniref:site-specific DNA-methyltransferase (adenine-specific) n=1 Tax=Baekduia soli TaxID=496014 RepID=A0A5B8U6K4_9ACTN|nr:N-6 DNA methylase [Baekduia soli]QEC48535.1 N-6 DNA methylase [Baekduia soli]
MGTPPELVDLVEKYQRNRNSYESAVYNETQLRREFVDPLLQILGWDVDNAAGYAEAYKDVVHEDSIRIEGSPKAPDYSLRIGGTRKFFVEAKKPSVKITNDKASAYQLRRYAWSAGLPLSLLTNFASLAVYDGRVPPAPNERAAKARILLVEVDELAERWDEIASIFARESVLRGNLDRYTDLNAPRRGTSPVDDYFLREIEEWRQALAADLATRNPDLNQAGLNYAVQATIDRIIFLRICEDRGLEDYGTLQSAAGRKHVYRQLLELFNQADTRYNSGLFHFATEADRGTPDVLTPRLNVDDSILRSILERLYFPESPYQFSVVSAEILGQVYEQFLGRVIEIGPDRSVSVNQKPEIRQRSGGVYYTPSYIVRFIVERTLGETLSRVTAENLVMGGKGRRRIRVVDPACGSGSFLIVAYQYLLDWYLAQYQRDVARWSKGRSPRIHAASRGDWRLTTAERKRILLDHIFGVDIDAQAVEVTKLSLLLKVLEGESAESLQLVMRILRERALPDLDLNIKAGNSLVGADVWTVLDEIPDEEAARINPFDWSREFPDAMAAGGFDAVFGNPPYVYRNATEDLLRSYYEKQYSTTQGNFELYKFFLERGMWLCKPEGLLGYIVSASFLIQTSFSRLREFLVRSGVIEHLAGLGPGAFSKATIDSAIIVVQKTALPANHNIEVRGPKRPTELLRTTPYPVPQVRFANNPDTVFDWRLRPEGAKIVERLLGDFPPVEEGFEFGVGINTGFIRGLLTADSKLDDRYGPMIAGDGISPMGEPQTDGWIMYDPDFVAKQGDRGRSLPQKRLLTEPKILVVRTRNLSLLRRIVSTIDTSGGYNLNRLSNIIARPGRELYGLLGLLNSSLYEWLFSTRYFDYEIKPVYLRSAPLADTEDPALIRLTKQMDRTTKALQKSNLNTEAERLKRQRDGQQRALDDQVFKLFSVTSEERKHIEWQLDYFAQNPDEPAATESFALTLAATDQRTRVGGAAG